MRMSETLLTAGGFERLNRDHARLRGERESLVRRMRSAVESGGPPAETSDYRVVGAGESDPAAGEVS